MIDEERVKEGEWGEGEKIKLDRETQGETLRKKMDQNQILKWRILIKGETNKRRVGGRQIGRGDKVDKERE